MRAQTREANIARGMRKSWRKRKRIEQELATRLLRALVYKQTPLDDRERELVPLLAQRATGPLADAVKAGRRIQIATYPAEVLAGDALEAVERARELLADDDALARALPR